MSASVVKQESQETAGDLVQTYGSTQKGTSLETVSQHDLSLLGKHFQEGERLQERHIGYGRNIFLTSCPRVKSDSQCFPLEDPSVTLRRETSPCCVHVEL